MTPTDEEYLQRLYEDPSSPAAFSSPNQLYREVRKRDERNISRSDIKKWLMKNANYTQNKQIVRHFKKRPIITPYIGYESDIDQAYMNHFNDNGYKYFLLMIDNFSKFVWTRPLKKLDGQHIRNALKSIIEETHIIPERIRSDKGREINNAFVDRYLKSQKIQHILSQNETQASIAERAIKTLKSRLLKYMVKNNTKKWVDVLQKITDGYNKAYNRSIGMAPIEVNKTNQNVIWNRKYNPTIKQRRKLSNDIIYSINKRNFRYQVGDTVLLALLKSAFSRGYNTRWSTEQFTITDRFLRQGFPVYKVKDQANRAIEGTFYTNELQKVDPQPDILYKIEKIVKKRTRRGQKEVLVRWLGYSKDYDSWIKSSNIKQYK